ncbi:unnamed protein product [Amoebophrya sp. A25]|nr:unnamed protein product [Amoebophrya sp. A25]|eukprot:GSA25T00025443001.1
MTSGKTWTVEVHPEDGWKLETDEEPDLSRQTLLDPKNWTRNKTGEEDPNFVPPYAQVRNRKSGQIVVDWKVSKPRRFDLDEVVDAYAAEFARREAEALPAGAASRLCIMRHLDPEENWTLLPPDVLTHRDQKHNVEKKNVVGANVAPCFGKSSANIMINTTTGKANHDDQVAGQEEIEKNEDQERVEGPRSACSEGTVSSSSSSSTKQVEQQGRNRELQDATESETINQSKTFLKSSNYFVAPPTAAAAAPEPSSSAPEEMNATCATLIQEDLVAGHNRYNGVHICSKSKHYAVMVHDDSSADGSLEAIHFYRPEVGLVLDSGSTTFKDRLKAFLLPFVLTLPRGAKGITNGVNEHQKHTPNTSPTDGAPVGRGRPCLSGTPAGVAEEFTQGHSWMFFAGAIFNLNMRRGRGSFVWVHCSNPDPTFHGTLATFRKSAAIQANLNHDGMGCAFLLQDNVVRYLRGGKSQHLLNYKAKSLAPSTFLNFLDQKEKKEVVLAALGGDNKQDKKKKPKLKSLLSGLKKKKRNKGKMKTKKTKKREKHHQPSASSNKQAKPKASINLDDTSKCKSTPSRLALKRNISSYSGDLLSKEFKAWSLLVANLTITELQNEWSNAKCLEMITRIQEAVKSTNAERLHMRAKIANKSGEEGSDTTDLKDQRAAMEKAEAFGDSLRQRRRRLQAELKRRGVFCDNSGKIIFQDKSKSSTSTKASSFIDVHASKFGTSKTSSSTANIEPQTGPPAKKKKAKEKIDQEVLTLREKKKIVSDRDNYEKTKGSSTKSTSTCREPPASLPVDYLLVRLVDLQNFARNQRAKGNNDKSTARGDGLNTAESAVTGKHEGDGANASKNQEDLKVVDTATTTTSNSNGATCNHLSKKLREAEEADVSPTFEEALQYFFKDKTEHGACRITLTREVIVESGLLRQNLEQKIGGMLRRHLLHVESWIVVERWTGLIAGDEWDRPIIVGGTSE